MPFAVSKIADPTQPRRPCHHLDGIEIHVADRGRLLDVDPDGQQSDAFDGNLALAVDDLVTQARDEVQARGGQLLASSGLLYSAHGQREATREISLMGGIASAGALLLMLLVFRRVRVLLAFIPAATGVFAGLTACVAVFGHTHVMTLVLGASLIGVAIDPPGVNSPRVSAGKPIQLASQSSALASSCTSAGAACQTPV